VSEYQRGLARGLSIALAWGMFLSSYALALSQFCDVGAFTLVSFLLLVVNAVMLVAIQIWIYRSHHKP